MMRLQGVILFLFFPLLLQAQDAARFDRSLALMGCEFKITVVAGSKQKANQYIDLAVEEIRRIESLISSWKENSETARINRNAGDKPVKVSSELFKLIKRAKVISRTTNGAFDISWAAVKDIWKFDGSMKEMPDEKIIKTSAKKINYKNIILNKKKQTVFLKKKGMRIDFGAIGKGYAADRARALFREKGVKGGIINASGDLTTWGEKPSGKSWTVGIKNPLNKNKVFSWVTLEDQAVVTSGDYENFVTFDGKRYSHIIDPRTGYPAHGLVSVSIFAPKAELADALATSVFVMGKEAGLSLVSQLNEVECIIIDQGGNIHKSQHIELKKVKP